MNYKIQRCFFSRPGRFRTIRQGLTLAEAQTHCYDPETSSSTATNPIARKRTRRYGAWFDTHTKDIK